MVTAGGNLAVGAKTLEQRPLFAVPESHQTQLDQLANRTEYGNELYALGLALEAGLNSTELEDYLDIQEKTHVKEGLELQQISTTRFKYTEGNVIDPHTGNSMVKVAKQGHEAQKKARKNGEGFDFMIQRTKIDIEIAEDNDNRMETSEIGETWMRFTPYAEEEADEDARSAGFWPESRRSFVWIYRKSADDALDATILSIDRSDVAAFAGLAHEFGVNLPSNVSSHDVPAHVIEVPGLIRDDHEADELISGIRSKYQELANVVDAKGIDMTSDEFIEQHAKAEIYSLKRLQKEIIYSLENNQLAPYVRTAGIALLETFGSEYLSSDEIADIMRAVNSTNPMKHVTGLELIMKAQRYGAWAKIGDKIREMKASAPTSGGNINRNVSFEWQQHEAYINQVQEEYRLGQEASDIDSQQLTQNIQAGKSAAERGEMQPGCPGGKSFLSQTEAEAKESAFGAERDSKKRWMSCPFCKKEKAVYDDPCSKNLTCRHCVAKVRDGKVVYKGNGGNSAESETDNAQAEIINIDEARELRAVDRTEAPSHEPARYAQEHHEEAA